MTFFFCLSIILNVQRITLINPPSIETTSKKMYKFCATTNNQTITQLLNSYWAVQGLHTRFHSEIHLRRYVTMISHQSGSPHGVSS